MAINSYINFEDIISQMVKEHIDSESDKVDIYKALCNIIWVHKVTGEVYTCSWRYAGGLISNAEGDAEYMAYCNYYCSGGEGTVEDWVAEELLKYGWEWSER